MIDGANPGMGIQAFDVGICYQLNKMGVPIWVDPTCWMLHMRYGGKKKVGIDPPDVWIDKVGEPRQMNKGMTSIRLNMAWEEFVKENMTNNQWMNKLLEEIVNTINAQGGVKNSKHFLETLN